jgi:hypothetical protein
VLEEAQGCVGADPNGHRREFLELVNKAAKLSNKATAAPQGEARN